MDRIMSDEERIRRAEAVAERRRNKSQELYYEKIQIEKNKSKSKKILIQIFVCLLIYCGLYYIKNLPDDNNMKKQCNEKINLILNYDIDLKKIYDSIFYKNKEINSNDTNDEKGVNSKDNIEENKMDEDTETNNNNISLENITFNLGIGGELEQNNQDESNEQIDDDVDYIKSNITLTNPLQQGVITSRFGEREASEIVSPNHRGIDLGASNGTEIISSCNGKVIEVSSVGDFGKHIKIQNSDVIFIYAHCNKLLVNKGDEIKIGQKIAEVGSTGRATGPHLHFEIRRGERAIDPELIMNFEK